MYSNTIGSPLEGSLPLELETPLNGTTASGLLNHGHYKYSKINESHRNVVTGLTVFKFL